MRTLSIFVLAVACACLGDVRASAREPSSLTPPWLDSLGAPPARSQARAPLPWPEQKVVASDGVHQVATVDKPPKALVKQLKEQHNAARGTVYRVHEDSQHLELLLED